MLNIRRFMIIAVIAFLGQLGSESAQAAAVVKLLNPSNTNLVISQVYGGGGFAGSVYTNDYVELFNPTGSAITITNWTLQYAAATGTSWTKSVNISGTIPAGRYYLVQLASSGASGLGLPTPDLVSTGVQMSTTSGKVVLVNNNTTIANGTSCPSGSTIIDKVGYGTSDCFEGTGPTPAPSSANSLFRNNSGCSDTDVNSADFITGVASARNSATAAHLCVSPTINVSGRILQMNGRTITNATVSLSGGTLPAPITVITGRNGAYSFNNIASNQTYTITVTARRFTFTQSGQSFTPINNVTNNDFYGQ